MFYIWIKYVGTDADYEPHMTFTNEELEEAQFEINDLRDQGYLAKFGREFK